MGKKKKSGASMDRPKDNQTISAGLLPILSQELEKAKQIKDHAVAAKLRKQVWVVTDFAHGVVPDMPKDELREILKDLPLTMPGEEDKGPAVQGPSDAAATAKNRMGKLRRQLKQIDQYKERLAKGDTLEKNQIDKIDTEESIREELKELQELMAAATT